MADSRCNPFDPIYAIMNSVEPSEKLAAVPPFPRLMDVELTNVCNFHCLMCPVGVDVQVRPKGRMTEEVFSRILDQAAEHNCHLRFILWGEPTLHPRWLDWMGRVVDRGLNVHFNTNGSRISDDDMRRIVELGVQSMKFSFQGVDAKSYREMRNTDYFDKLLERVKRLHEIRGEARYPYLHVSTTITYEGPELVREFRDRLAAFTDKVTIGRTELGRFDSSTANLSAEERGLLEHMKREDKLVRKHPRCPEVFDKLSVYWDGRVTACCRDLEGDMLLGDIHQTPLSELWLSPKLAAYRQALARNEHDSFPLCRECWDYHGLQTPGLQGL